jgi:hypothetical protein
MSGQVEQAVNLGNGNSFGTVDHFHNLVASPNFSFLQHSEIKSWSVMCNEKSRHSRFIHADAYAVARHTWLAHFKYRITNAVSISNADFVIRKSFDGEVFSELAEDEVITSERAFPIVIGLHLIDKDGSLLPSMTGEIALPVANDVERAHHPSAFHW